MADEELTEPDRLPGTPHPRETLQLFGQSRAEAGFLEAKNEGRLHHAWLLRGPLGVGKATLAYRMARALIAEDPEAGVGLFGDGPASLDNLDMAADHPVARRIAASGEPRLKVLRLGADERTGRMRSQIVVEDVRAVKNFLQLSAADGGWRVVIVDTADLMNRSAANALLKLLEEPPARVVLILLSHSPGGLLPTIRSRCRVLDLAPLGAADLNAALAQAGIEVGASDAALLTELAGGSAGRAARLQTGGGLALYRRISGMIADGRIDRSDLLGLADQVKGKDGPQLYPLLRDMTETLIGRLARAAAMQRPPATPTPEEQALIPLAASHAPQGRLWAEAAQTTAQRFRHAVAVNLDPGQTIIDTFLDLETVLQRAKALG